MRTDDERLHTCPTCGSDAEHIQKGLGLRDYRWINDVLPGKEGCMDGDAIYEKKGHVLMLETKPARKSEGLGMGLGQLITLKALVRKGVYVLMVWGPKAYNDAGLRLARPTYEWGYLNERGEVLDVYETSLEGLKEEVLSWRQDAIDGNLI